MLYIQIKESMSASKGVCRDLLKDTSVLQGNRMDYKSDIDNLRINSSFHKKISKLLMLSY